MEKKRRVALYLPLGTKKRSWNGLGGAEKRLSYLISHMDPKRFQPCIVLRIYCGKETAINAIKEYVSSYCNVRVVESDREAFKFFKNEKYDYVLYDDCMVLTIPGVIGAWRGGSHRVLIFVTEYYAKWQYKKKWHAIIMRFNGVLSSSIDTLYPASKKILERIFPNREITVTPCSLPKLEEYLSESAPFLKENKIVFASRLIKDKNPMLVIDAVKNIYKELVDKKYQVIICGDGPLNRCIEESIATQNLQEVINFIGMQNMQDILPSTQVFLSLQENENYPSQSLLEAIASGCICIATNVGETSLVVKPEFGILVEKNVKSLSQALLRILNMNSEEKQKASIQARMFAKEMFRPQKAIEHYEEICK